MANFDLEDFPSASTSFPTINRGPGPETAFWETNVSPRGRILNLPGKIAVVRSKISLLGIRLYPEDDPDEPLLCVEDLHGFLTTPSVCISASAGVHPPGRSLG